MSYEKVNSIIDGLNEASISSISGNKDKYRYGGFEFDDGKILGIHVSFPLNANKAKSLVSAFRKFFKGLEGDLIRRNRKNYDSLYHSGDLELDYYNTKISDIVDSGKSIEKECYAQMNLFTSGYYYETGGTLSKDEILNYLYSKLPREYIHYKGDTYFTSIDKSKNPIDINFYYSTEKLDDLNKYLIRDSFYIVAKIRYIG